MKQFDDEFQLEYAITTGDNPLGYLDVYGEKNVPEMDIGILYKGRRVLPIFGGSERFDLQNGKDTQFFFAQLWKGRSLTCWVGAKDYHSIYLYSITHKNGSTSSVYNLHGKNIDFYQSYDKLFNFRNLMDYKRLRFLAFVKGLFR